MIGRLALLLGACGAVAAGAWLLARPQAPAEAPFGWGGVTIGMSRDAAIRVAGPGALVGPLCGDAEGAAFDLRDDSVALAPGRPVSVMAMFADGAVSEIDVSLAEAEGGWSVEHCLGVAEARLGTLAGRHGAARPAWSVTEAPGVVSRSARFEGEAGGVSVLARAMPRSGACFVNLRWIAAGRESVIRLDGEFRYPSVAEPRCLRAKRSASTSAGSCARPVACFADTRSSAEMNGASNPIAASIIPMTRCAHA